MSKHPAGAIAANGVAVPIFVTDQGQWEAEYAGRSLSFPVREKLEASIKRLTKTTTVPVEVPFVRIEKRGDLGVVRTRGTATGIHSGNGNVLVIWQTRHGDQKDQTKSSGGSYNAVDFGDTSDEVVVEFAKLVRDEALARQAREEFERKHKIDIKDEVLKAIKEATEDADGS